MLFFNESFDDIGNICMVLYLHQKSNIEWVLNLWKYSQITGLGIMLTRFELGRGT